VLVVQHSDRRRALHERPRALVPPQDRADRHLRSLKRQARTEAGALLLQPPGSVRLSITEDRNRLRRSEPLRVQIDHQLLMDE
jgi:hypothetical protein